MWACINEVVFVRFSALDAHTWLKPHHGHTNAQLKMHLGLIVPVRPSGESCALFRVGTETRAWQQGHVLFFDDSFEHEVCPMKYILLLANNLVVAVFTIGHIISNVDDHVVDLGLEQL